MTLNGSVVGDNIVNGLDAEGDGVYSAFGGTLNVTSSTFQGNTVIGDNARGGGIFTGGSATTTLQSSVVVSNQAVGSGADGGGIFQSFGTATIPGSTVVGNQPNNCGNPQHGVRLFLGPFQGSTGTTEALWVAADLHTVAFSGSRRCRSSRDRSGNGFGPSG